MSEVFRVWIKPARLALGHMRASENEQTRRLAATEEKSIVHGPLRALMDSSACMVGWCSTGGLCYCFLNKKSSVVLISILSLLVSLADAASPAPGCSGDIPGQLAGLRDHVAALHDVLQLFFQAANVLLIIASFFETPALMQVYVWGALASIVLGFAAAILDALLRARSGSRWVIVNFVSEVAFLFVLYLCVPLVDAYRRQLEEAQ